MNDSSFLIVAAVLVGFALLQFFVSRPGLKPAVARAAVEAGTAVLIDLREPREWTSGVARQAALLPFSDLRGPRTKWEPFLQQHRGQRLFLYCAAGTRAGLAARTLRAEGVDAVNVGSLAAWARAGWPVGPAA